MVIVLENGVSLPDIPDDVLAKYPYVSITYVKMTGDYGESYSLVCTSTPLYYDNETNYVFALSTGYYSAGIFGDDTETWLGAKEYTEETFEGDMTVNSEMVETMEVAWANHDIMVAVDVDDSGNVTTDGIYFPNSTITYEEEYKAPTTWFKGIADVVRKLTGVVKRYTTDEMLQELETVNVDNTTYSVGPNGKKWTLGQCDIELSENEALTMGNQAYANGIFVSVAMKVNLETYEETPSGIVWSEDGKTWNQSNLTDANVYKIIYNDEVWVATSKKGSTGSYWSEDGKTWNQSDLSTINMYNCVYADGLWVVHGNYVSAGLFWSEDGKTWNQSNVPDICAAYVLNAKGIWLASASDSIYRSEDGKNWETVLSGISSEVFYGNGLFVTRGHYSIDGRTWTPNNNQDVANLGCCLYKNGIWVMTGSIGDDDIVFWSEDGKTWNQSNVTNLAYTNCYIEYSNGLWMIQCNVMYVSEDGKTWTELQIDGVANDSCYWDGLFKNDTVWLSSLVDETQMVICYYWSYDGYTWFKTNFYDDYLSMPFYANGIWIGTGNINGNRGPCYSVVWEPS